MPNPQPQDVYTHNGQQVTLQGTHTHDPQVWIGHVAGSGDQVYISNDWLNMHNQDGSPVEPGAVTNLVTEIEDPSSVRPARPRRATPAPTPTPTPAPAQPAPHQAEDGEEIEADDRPARRRAARRPTCPACDETFTGMLGREHACAAVKLARCRSCFSVEARHLEVPPRPPYLCGACTGAGKFVCKACNNIQNTRGRYGDVCDRCNPLPAQNVWNALNNKAKGDDMTIVIKSHIPFAVEVESFLLPAKQVTPRGRLSAGWHEGHDGSIRPDPGATESVEFKSPPLKGDGGLAILYSDVKKLRDMGFRANKSCGLHCHVDMISSSVQDREAVYKFGTWIQDDIYKLVARSRASADYCKKITTTLANEQDRYLWMNMKAAFQKHKTVEFRLHHGTTQPDRVVEWVKVCVRIVEVGLKLGHLRQRPSGTLFDLLNFNAYEREYWLDVARSLHGHEIAFGTGA